MSLSSFAKGKILSKVLQNLADSEPKTTLIGLVLGAVVASKVDYSKLLQGDPNEIANVVSAAVVALLGYYTNHKQFQAKP